MANHDNYDKNILKALQKIANSLDRIEKKMPDKSPTSVELKESIDHPMIENESSIFKR